jgi:replicative DNA helicase
VPIQDLVGQKDFRVLSLNPETYTLIPASVTHAFSTGRKPIYKLTTQLGRTIRATGNHKFFTIHGWQRLDALTTTDYLAIPRQLPTLDEQTMTNAELALLGHLIGDGCTLPRHAIQYTTREFDLAKTVALLVAEVFGEKVQARIQRERQWYQVYLPSTMRLTHGRHNPVTTWLKNFGVFGLRSYQKFVPRKVFGQPSAAIAVFLRHLWSTDGCIRNTGVYPQVYYASSSERLARDVQTLLLQLGITARLKRVAQKRKGRDQYHVCVTGNQDLRRFIDVIGSVGEYKRDGLDTVKQYVSSHGINTNRDIIPAFVWQEYAVPAMQACGLSQRQMQQSLGMQYMGSSLYSQNLSRGRAARVATMVDSDVLTHLSQSDIYWDQIVSIEPDGEEEVYDLTVPEYSNFVANNVTVHNSIEQDADVVLFLYRKDDDIRESVNLKVAKHRNGALGEIDLYFKGDRIKFYGMEMRR